jgi:hypothetical protein
MKTNLPCILALALLILAFGCKQEDYFPDTTGVKPIYISIDALEDIGNLNPQPTETTGSADTVGNVLFLVESNKGIHVIDISNPPSQVKLTFIKIPAVNNFTIDGNILSADNGLNLVSLEISDVSHVVILNINRNFFKPILAPPLQYQGYFECVDTDRGFVIDWEDTFLQNAKCKTFL